MILEKKDLHLYGLVSCFVASKLEDRKCIKMSEVLKEAGHGKFTKEEIIIAEKDIYTTLNYCLISNSLIDEVLIAMRISVPP